jgi:prepilin-type processing-associated H-X9-DG protein
MMMYVQDNKEYWPHQYWQPAPINWQPAGVPAAGFSGEIASYVGDLQVFLCPSKTNLYCSYIYNMYLPTRTVGAIASASNVITFGDSYADGGVGLDNPNQVYPYINAVTGAVSATLRLSAPHSDGANLGFADGHVVWQSGLTWKPSQWQPIGGIWVP